MSNTVGASALHPILFEKLAEESARAKEDYRNSDKDPTSPLELERQEMLLTLNQLRTQIMLDVSHQTIALKLLTMIEEQLVRLYRADDVDEFQYVAWNLSKLRSYLEKYRSMMERRTVARQAAVIAAVLVLVALGVLIFFGTLPGGPDVETILPIIQIPLPVIVWSVLGTLVAVLYRFHFSGKLELHDPMRWLFIRPVTGVMMGIISYLVVKISLLSVLENALTVGTAEILWLIAFAGGFSDRLSETVLNFLGGHQKNNDGEEEEEELVSLDRAINNPTSWNPFVSKNKQKKLGSSEQKQLEATTINEDENRTAPDIEQLVANSVQEYFEYLVEESESPQKASDPQPRTSDEISAENDPPPNETGNSSEEIESPPELVAAEDDSEAEATEYQAEPLEVQNEADEDNIVESISSQEETNLEKKEEDQASEPPPRPKKKRTISKVERELQSAGSVDDLIDFYKQRYAETRQDET